MTAKFRCRPPPLFLEVFILKGPRVEVLQAAQFGVAHAAELAFELFLAIWEGIGRAIFCPGGRGVPVGCVALGIRRNV